MVFQVWLKLAQWFWRGRFLIFVNIYSLFCYYLPLEKGMVLHLNKLESTSPKDALYQVWLKFGSVVLEKKKMWKVYDNDDDNNDAEDGQRTYCDQKSSFSRTFGSGGLKREGKERWSRYSFRLYQSDLIQINTYLVLARSCMVISEDFLIIFLGERS